MKKGFWNVSCVIFTLAFILSCASQESPAPEISGPPKPAVKTYKVPSISQIKPLDDDGDGVQNYRDKCP